MEVKGWAISEQFFDQVPNVTRDYLGFGLFRSMIGPENSCQTQT